MKIKEKKKSESKVGFFFSPSAAALFISRSARLSPFDAAAADISPRRRETETETAARRQHGRAFRLRGLKLQPSC